MNSPRQDEVLLSATGISLDRALFTLLVALSRAEKIDVARFADEVGRDASTISRQLAKLEQLGMVKHPPADKDLRVRQAAITKAGSRAVAVISEARRKLLRGLLQVWSAEEQKIFSRLLQQFADAMKRQHG